MKQNIYDNPEFFDTYLQLRKHETCLNKVLEEPAINSLLPSLDSKSVVDLGCGFGRFCRHASSKGAKSVIGVGISKKMLQEARNMTGDTQITCVNSPIEKFDIEPQTADIVLSSLALHYVENLDGLLKKVFWPVDNYRKEGKRVCHWIVDGVIKYHRTMETYINSLIDSGFTIKRILEPEAAAEFMSCRPELAEKSRRPPFLVISSQKII
jgi:SAM-dependent methyltransferase